MNALDRFAVTNGLKFLQVLPFSDYTWVNDPWDATLSLNPQEAKTNIDQYLETGDLRSKYSIVKISLTVHNKKDGQSEEEVDSSDAAPNKAPIDLLETGSDGLNL